MIAGLLISILLIYPAIQQVQEENSLIPRLDTKAVTYCELSACGYLDTLGLEIVSPPLLEEGEFGTEVFVQVINRGRLYGEREFWAQLRTQDGAFVEAMRGDIVLTNQGPQLVRFFFTGKKAEFQGLVMEFGY